MSWVKHVAYIGVYKNWLEKLKETGHFENPGIDGWIILKWISKKENGKVWTEFMWLKIRTGSTRRRESQKRSCELSVDCMRERLIHERFHASPTQCLDCSAWWQPVQWVPLLQSAMSQHPHILVRQSLVYFTPPHFKMLPHEYYLCGSLTDNVRIKNTYKEDDWMKLSGVPYQQYLDKKLKNLLMCSPGGTHAW
jgi:hypothetical protein